MSERSDKTGKSAATDGGGGGAVGAGGVVDVDEVERRGQAVEPAGEGDGVAGGVVDAGDERPGEGGAAAGREMVENAGF